MIERDLYVSIVKAFRLLGYRTHITPDYELKLIVDWLDDLYTFNYVKDLLTRKPQPDDKVLVPDEAYTEKYWRIQQRMKVNSEINDKHKIVGVGEAKKANMFNYNLKGRIL